MESQLTYDDKGRLTERLVGAEKTSMSYDSVGNLITITAPSGITLSYEYDAANRLVAIADTDDKRIDYTLDPMGNRIEEKVSDASGQLTRRQQKVYDELSRLLISVGASGQTTTYGYDRNDNRTSVIDPQQQLHRSAYDGLNRLIEQTNPINGVTSYGYDTHDRLTSVTDPNRNTTTYLYDGLSNLTEQHSPDTGVTTFTHDVAGNVLTKTDAAGQITRYTYDALNRLSQTTYDDGTVVTYTYDTAPNGIGRLAQISEPGLTIAWAYDLHGRTVSRSRTLQEGKKHTLTQTTAWQYDNDGHLSGISYPSGLQVHYGYRNGKIDAVTVDGKPLLNTITYHPFGPISGWTWANGSRSLRGYDLDGRLISQTLGNGQRQLSYDANGNLTAISGNTNWSYVYDALNRLTAANNLAWEYDANGNRLNQDNSGAITTYTINPTSNRLTAVNDVQGCTNVAGAGCAGATTTAYSYDPNGNLIDDGSYSYQYDAQNRLITIDNGDTAEYRYNALGQRIRKIAIDENCGDNSNHNGWEKENKRRKGNDKAHRKNKHEWHDNITCVERQRKEKHDDKERNRKDEKDSKGKESAHHREHNRHHGYSERLFVYDDHRLLGEYNRKGKPVQETVWLGNLPVATVKHKRVYAIHSDHLGTPRIITDKHNTEVWRWDSDPFGTTPANEDPDGDGRTFSYNLRFPGQYFDQETGRHYNYFRDYDPATGRYIESDPIGLRGGLNTYSYVKSNPIKNMDPHGNICITLPDGMGQYCDGWFDDYKTTENIINGYAKRAGQCISCEAECLVNFVMPGAVDVARIAANKAANKIVDEGIKMATKAMIRRVNIVVTVYDAAVAADCLLKCE